VPLLGYLGRLSKRMAKAHFPPDDPLRLLVGRSEDTVHRLRIDLHYSSVEARRKAAETDPPKSLTD
jgi:hypothetical protein